MHVSMQDPSTFLRMLFNALEGVQIDTAGMELDHLCYRVESIERYDALRSELNKTAILLGESSIGGRPIATYRLRVPFLFDARRIDVVELPAPKPGSPYPEGFEHAEFVVAEGLFAFTEKYPDLPWDLSGSTKPSNAEVRLHFDGFSVKFHRQPLAEVIELEQGLEAGEA